VHIYKKIYSHKHGHDFFIIIICFLSAAPQKPNIIIIIIIIITSSSSSSSNCKQITIYIYICIMCIYIQCDRVQDELEKFGYASSVARSAAQKATRYYRYEPPPEHVN
jgi:hypothetical protein